MSCVLFRKGEQFRGFPCLTSLYVVAWCYLGGIAHRHSDGRHFARQQLARRSDGYSGRHSNAGFRPGPKVVGVALSVWDARAVCDYVGNGLVWNFADDSAAYFADCRGSDDSVQTSFAIWRCEYGKHCYVGRFDSQDAADVRNADGGRVGRRTLDGLKKSLACRKLDSRKKGVGCGCFWMIQRSFCLKTFGTVVDGEVSTNG